MKKLLPKLIIGIVVLVIIAVVAVFMSLNSIVKKGVETVGPQITKVSVTLDSVKISPLSGSGGIRGLVVGNPEGYKTESAIKLGEASLAVDAMSVFSDKVHVKWVNVVAPEITFEGGLKGSNLTKLLANVQEAAGGSSGGGSASSGTSKKLQVDEVTITGARVNISATLLGGKAASVTLPEIRLKDLGTGSDGITPAELTEKVLSIITEKSVELVGEQLTKLGQGLGDTAEKAGGSAVEGVKKAGEGLKGLFKKKE